MTAVDQVRTRLLRARVMRIGAIASAVAAIILGLGGGVWALASIGLFAAVRRPSPADAADHLDAQLDQDGGVRTAWDHRTDASPMAAAQRQRLSARLTTDTVRTAAPAAHPAWILGFAVFAWPLLQASSINPGSRPTVASAGSTAPSSSGPAAPGTDGVGETPASAASKASVRSTAPRSTPPNGPTSQGGGNGGATAKVAGVGAQAGDRMALPAAAERVGLSPGTAAGLWLSDASGASLPDPPIRVALAPPGGSPDDDITDPARPYPRRYHPLIARWFARR